MHKGVPTLGALSLMVLTTLAVGCDGDENTPTVCTLMGADQGLIIQVWIPSASAHALVSVDLDPERPGPHIDLICPIEEGETCHVELDASQGDDAAREDLEARIFTEVEPGRIRVMLDREYPESVEVLVAVHGAEGTDEVPEVTGPTNYEPSYRVEYPNGERCDGDGYRNATLELDLTHP